MSDFEPTIINADTIRDSHIADLAREVRLLRRDIRVRPVMMALIAIVTALIILLMFSAYYTFITAPFHNETDNRQDQLDQTQIEIQRRLGVIESKLGITTTTTTTDPVEGDNHSKPASASASESPTSVATTTTAPPPTTTTTTPTRSAQQTTTTQRPTTTTTRCRLVTIPPCVG